MTSPKTLYINIQDDLRKHSAKNANKSPDKLPAFTSPKTLQTNTIMPNAPQNGRLTVGPKMVINKPQK